eukprot:TRINITY_DN39654_c0_g1_i1.p1 TRINITY_DN39654_c0_g1~~TRINITY_DN39654_c0_g1_i1.p1  ORF type:complete len:218 (+),score=20.13 TRINITY_DN39654_c0_g1_i1:77-655(+)
MGLSVVLLVLCGWGFQGSAAGGMDEAAEANVKVVPSSTELTSRELMTDTEMPVYAWRLPLKDKLVLVVLEVFGLGICGIDRCYMGENWLGVSKGLTLGGLGAWALFDAGVVFVNALQRLPYIDSFGFRARFTGQDQDAPFILAVFAAVALLGNLGHRLCTSCARRRDFNNDWRESCSCHLSSSEESTAAEDI